MIKAKDVILLRQYALPKGEEVILEDVKEVYEAALRESGIEALIIDSEMSVGGTFNSKVIPAFEFISIQNADYLHMYVIAYEDKNTPLIEVVTIGKGEQIKDVELGSLFVKKSAKLASYMKGMSDAYNRGKSLGMRFGTVGGAKVGSAIGVGTSAIIKGGFKLAAKGIKLAMRDKEAYDKEMNYYMSILALSDAIIDGTLEE